MLRIGERVLAGNIKLIKAYLMQEHVNTAEVIGRNIDFLTIETVADSIPAQKLSTFEQQRAGAAGRVISLIDFLLAYRAQARKQHTYFRRGKELAAAFAGTGCIHAHKVFISITKGINGMVVNITKVHILHAVKQLCKALVALRYGRTKLIAVNVKIIEQTGEIRLRLTSLGRTLDVVEDTFQTFVKVLVIGCISANIAKEFAGQHKKALFLDKTFAGFLCVLVGHLSIIKVSVTCFNLILVNIISQILRNKAIKHSAQHIVFKIPAVYSSAQLIRNRPNSTVKLFSFLFLLDISHVKTS